MGPRRRWQAARHEVQATPIRAVDVSRPGSTREVSGGRDPSAKPPPWKEEVELDEDQLRQALERYGLISPLLAVRHRGERQRLLGELPEIFGASVPSRATLYRYMQRYREENLEGLLPRRRSDAAKCRAIPEEVQAQIVDLAQRYVWLSTPVLIDVLQAEHEGLRLAPATVNRLLRAQGVHSLREEQRRYTYGGGGQAAILARTVPVPLAPAHRPGDWRPQVLVGPLASCSSGARPRRSRPKARRDSR